MGKLFREGVLERRVHGANPQTVLNRYEGRKLPCKQCLVYVWQSVPTSEKGRSRY